MVDHYFGSGCDTVFECLLKHNSLSDQLGKLTELNNCNNIEQSFKQLELGLSFRTGTEGLGLSFRFFLI